MHMLSTLYDRSVKIYGADVLTKSEVYEIIQCEVNMIYINKGYQYILRQLEIYHGVVVN